MADETDRRTAAQAPHADTDPVRPDLLRALNELHQVAEQTHDMLLWQHAALEKISFLTDFLQAARAEAGGSRPLRWFGRLLFGHAPRLPVPPPFADPATIPATPQAPAVEPTGKPPDESLLAALQASLNTSAQRMGALAAEQQAIAERTRYLEDFLNALRAEIRGSLPARAARLFTRRPIPKAEAGGEPDDEPAGGWHEDFVRVYPGGQSYGPDGKRRDSTDADRRNFLNHVKFYRFAAQFVSNRCVLDCGCGSGYGCDMLVDAGARDVHGCDLSDHALFYARMHFGHRVEFTRQSCTNMNQYRDGRFDCIICSEVLEHLAETGEVDDALHEMKRVAAPGAVFVIATPNVELLENHGFTFEALDAVCRRHFTRVCLIENALIPFSEDGRRRWEARRRAGRLGTVVTESINLAETDLPPGVCVPADGSPMVKSSTESEAPIVAGRPIDTTHLHNTHSFVVIAQTAAPSSDTHR